MIAQLPTLQPQAPHRFPPAWLWLVDELIPGWVKTHYSPRDSWKDKPFSKQDAGFFSKGIEELSELFTEERPRAMPAYFQHPKFRSSYLLYFLPLQAAKFSTLFQRHEAALEAALRHGREKGALRVLDLGAGPGTASLAFLLWLLGRRLEIGEELPPVELDWYDTEASILRDGKALAEEISRQFPRLRGKVTVRTHVAPWWKAEPAPYSLILVGHVLNEAPGARGGASSRARSRLAPLRDEEDERSADDEADRGIDQNDEVDPDHDANPTVNHAPARRERPAFRDAAADPLQRLYEKAEGGGMLLVEPAARRASQLLSRLRDQLLATEAGPSGATALWGPCLHAGRCPMSEGRDWCHFSIPVDIPGTWFKVFSKNLGSERQWIKFSYLWLAARTAPAKAAPADFRRVISDPLQKEGKKEVLLCEPDRAGRVGTGAVTRIHRGDIVSVKRSR